MFKNLERFEWSCPNERLDIEEALFLSKYFEKTIVSKITPDSLESHRFELHVNLQNVKFCTLYGTLGLVTVISRCICHMINVIVMVPNHPAAEGFLKYFGFMDLLQDARNAEVVVIVSELHISEPHYRNGKKVFHTKPIRANEDTTQFLKTTNIRYWINQLDYETRDSGFFQQGRFSRIICAELTNNIALHANLLKTEKPGRNSFGVVGMRVLKLSEGKGDYWVQDTYGNNINDFLRKHVQEGFVEVCICDPGIGIRNSLENSFNDSFKMANGSFPEKCNDENSNYLRSVEILQFAFDEFGTSKSENEQWLTDSHALSRILGLVQVYGGILEIIASNVKLTYRLDQYPLNQSKLGLGYEATEDEGVHCPWGTFIRIIVPLTRSKHIQDFSEKLKVQGRKLTSSTFDKPQIISISSELENNLLDNPSNFSVRAEILAKSLIKVQAKRPIIFDFSSTLLWKADHIATFLDKMTNIIRTRFTLMVGLNPDVAKELEERVFGSYTRHQKLLKDEEFLLLENEQIENKYSPFLKCLVDFHRVLLALDIEGGVYWVGAPSLSVKIALTSLLTEPGNHEEVCKRAIIYERHLCPTPKAEIIFDILKSSQELFRSYSIESKKEYPCWEVVIDAEILDEYRGKALIEHLQRHLGSVSNALWGIDEKQAFLLPHSKKYASKYIECDRLFQEEEFLQETSEILSRLLWFSLDEQEPSVLITTSAPSILLASAMRQWFDEPPIIIDIGHYFDDPKKRALKSLDGSEKVVIIQDIIDSGKTITNIVDNLDDANIKVSGVVCLIEFEDKGDYGIIPGSVTKKLFGKHKLGTAFVSLFIMKRPLSLKEEDLDVIDDYNKFWIEPYSLHPFRMEFLKKAKHDFLRNPKTIARGKHIDKLDLLEEYKLLAKGHFIYENHHFSIIIRMLKLFEKSPMSEQVVDEIARLSDNKSGDLVLIIPLHSHIKFLIPKLLDKLSSKSIKPPCIYAIVAKELGKRPYYMIPKRLGKMFDTRHKILHKENTRKFNILIIDDASATLRTFETLFRAIYLADTDFDDNETCINKIDIWSIANRTGKAKSTFLHSIKRLFNAEFSYNCFLDFDNPVCEADDCHLCKEYQHICNMRNVIEKTAGLYLREWINQRIGELEPIIVDTPQFNNMPHDKFPNDCIFVFDEYKSCSTSLASYIFLEKAERGCPARYLMEKFSEFTINSKDYLNDKNIQMFRVYVWRWLLSNWKRIASDVGTVAFYKIFNNELSLVSQQVPDILEVASRQYQNGILPRETIIKMLESTFSYLTTISHKCGGEPNLSDMEVREDIFSALVLTWVNLRTLDMNDKVLNLFEEKISELPNDPLLPGDFQGSMRETFRITTLFLGIEQPSYLECLKLSSMEVLVKSLGDRSSGRYHANRIIKHLKPILEIDEVDENDNEAITKIQGSIGFLEIRLNTLCQALEEVLSGRFRGNIDLETEWKMMRENFKTLITKLYELKTKKNGISYWSKSNSEWQEIRKAALYLEQNLFSPDNEVYKEVKAKNVVCSKIITIIERKAIENCVEERLKIHDLTSDGNFTVFADWHELYNLLSNHVIDVLKQHKRLNICLEITEDVDGNNPKIEFKIKTQENYFHEAYMNLTHGHSLRFEMWGLKKYGAIFNINDIENDDEYSLEMKCTLIRGFE
jgi:orotate phosphoribosyltransferase